VTTSQPRCAACGKLATGAIFVPSLAGCEYVVAVCNAHDLMQDGEHFTLAAMREAPAAFLSAFDQQIIDPAPKLRAWLVEVGRDVPMPEALTVAQAAELANVSARAIQRLCQSGALGSGAWRTSDGARASWRIDREALEKWKGRPRRRAAAPQVQAADVTVSKRSGSVVW
jgi:excisionase family DNA binding protein